MRQLILIPILALACHIGALDSRATSEPASFYAVTQEGQDVRMARYQFQGAGRWKRLSDWRLIDLEASHLKGFSLVYGEVSPDGTLVALGLNGPMPQERRFPQRTLVIFDVRQQKTVYQWTEAQPLSFRWFAWKEPGVLQFYRAVDTRADGTTWLDVYALQGPDWSSSEAKVTPEPVELRQVRLWKKSWQQPGFRSLTAKFGRLLNEQGYTPPYTVPNGEGAMVTGGWEAVFDGVTGAVDPDHDAAAALVQRLGSSRPVVVLVGGSNAGRVRVISSDAQLWLVEFWRSWLVIGQFQDRKPHDGKAAPGGRPVREKVVRLIDLAAPQNEFTLRADLFLANSVHD